MEDGLGDLLDEGTEHKVKTVLILVLVEDGLGDSQARWFYSN